MNGSEYFLEDDEFFEDDEADLDEFFEDEPEDDSERTRRRGRGRLPRVKPGRTGAGKGYTRNRPGSKFVTQVQFQAGLARVGKDIKQNGEAIKKVTAQINKTNSTLNAASVRQDKEIANLKKEMKKQSETSLLLTLLTPTPKLSAPNPTAPTTTAGQVATSVQVSPPDLLLPLLLGGGLGGSTGGDSNNNLLLILALTGGLGGR